VAVRFGPIKKTPYHVFTIEKNGKRKEQQCFDGVDRCRAVLEKQGYKIISVSETRWTESSDVYF
jgi:hypothetical protein